MIRLRQGYGTTGRNEQNERAFRIFFLEHLIIVSSFGFRASDFLYQRIAPAMTVGGFQRDRERLKGHRVVVIEELAAESEEFGAGRDAADLVKELTGRFNAEADEVHILLQVVDLGGLPDAGRADGFVKRVHISEHVASRRAEHGRASVVFPEMAARLMLNREA
jgi:hypothetical protein